MKDYYKILGIEEEASEEEIRAHWIELTKRYHPDLSKGRDAEEKFKEINEAYRILKDPSTRLEYDLEKIFRNKSLDKIRRLAKRRKNIRKAWLSFGIALVSVMGGLVMFRWFYIPGPPPSEVIHPVNRIEEKKTVSTPAPVKTESKVRVEEKVLRATKKEIPPDAPAKIAPPLPVFPLAPAEKESEPDEAIQPMKKPPQEAPIAVEKKAPEEVPVRIPFIPTAPPTPAEVQKEPKPVDKPIEKMVVPPVQPSKPPVKEAKEPPVEVQEKVLKETPREASPTVPREDTRVAKPEPAPIAPKPVLPPPFVREEEVNQFFSNYIDRYNRKDINRFLSLFSSKAIQNQKDGFEEIRNIYAKFFDQSRELRYHMEGIKIDFYQNSVEVRARYRLDQIFKKKGEEKLWKGNIRWVLVKEDGVLRIITLDYQNDKSP